MPLALGNIDILGGNLPEDLLSHAVELASFAVLQAVAIQPMYAQDVMALLCHY